MRVGQIVRQLVQASSTVVHAARVGAVVKVVDGIVRGGRLSPATIGRNLAGSGRPKHGIKCVDRLLGSAHMARDRPYFFLGITHHLVQGCSRPVIAVDWTQAGAHVALVAAVPIGGRALPIYLEVHRLKKLGNAAVEKRFLCTLGAVLPRQCRPIIISDAGFKGPFFQAVRELGWDFLGRVRGTTKAICANGILLSKEALYAHASVTPKDLGPFRLFVKHRLPCRLVLVRKRRRPGRKPPPPFCKAERELRQAALDPWLLATSLNDADADLIVSVYARRMQIEETFRDAKNHRFGWSFGHVRLSTPQRTATLLALAVIALLVMTLIGMRAERRGEHRAYQANTAKTRVLSLFVLAAVILRRGDPPAVSHADLRISFATLSRAASL